MGSFSELDIVRLRYDTADGETVLRQGTLGTIVLVDNEGEAYEVEFAEPVGTLWTLGPLDIVPIADAA